MEFVWKVTYKLGNLHQLSLPSLSIMGAQLRDTLKLFNILMLCWSKGFQEARKSAHIILRDANLSDNYTFDHCCLFNMKEESLSGTFVQYPTDKNSLPKTASCKTSHCNPKKLTYIICRYLDRDNLLSMQG